MIFIICTYQSIYYHTNALSLSETLETSMPILELKACMVEREELTINYSLQANFMKKTR
jgi:hypothetical protein